MATSRVINPTWHPLVDGSPPEWAAEWGEDRFGVWSVIDLSPFDSDVRQVMRWIPPGPFRMGSPDGEPGRWENEGPQHEVILTRGFWIFDTPVTQAMWEAVMGKENNPSRFRTPDRPVEQVSWDDCQAFIEAINKEIRELDLSLPTEAQWEYACRARTRTALYTGPIKIRGERNAPALDPIAWYGGNCGIDFELTNGYDASSWSEKQFKFTKGGTHPVGRKAPNDWGLFDMLGNVWEWCDDKCANWSVGYESADRAIDPAGPPQGSQRVLRGGDWLAFARVVRSASRFAGDPGGRYSRIGFRCVRVQAS